MIHVAVLMGGRSSEHEVSLATGQMMLRELDVQRYRAKAVRIDRDGLWRVSPGYAGALAVAGLDSVAAVRPGAALAQLERDHVEVALLGLHGPGGEDGSIQGMFETAGIAFTGAGVAGSAIAMDKLLAKKLLASARIATPAYAEVERIRVDDASDATRGMGFPLVVKVPHLGSSTGMGLAKDAVELARTLRELFAQFPETDRILVEQYVAGRELTCGVLAGPSGEPVALPPTEIRRPGLIFDYHAKYTPGACEEITPAPLPAHQIARVQDLAVACHKELRAGSISRTDMILTSDGALVVLELNTLPGMTATSLVPQAAAASGLAFGALLDRLIDYALASRPQLRARARA